MKKQLGFPGIGFADSEFESFYMNDRDNTLAIYLTSWDEKELCLLFSNPIQFSYMLGDAISDFYEISDSQMLAEALSQKYIKIEKHQEFKLFQIWDINDFPFISIVAQSVNVTKGENIVGFRS